MIVINEENNENITFEEDVQNDPELKKKLLDAKADLNEKLLFLRRNVRNH